MENPAGLESSGLCASSARHSVKGMLDCLIVSPLLAPAFPHDAPRHPPMQALLLAGVLRAAGARVQLVELYHRGPAFARALAEEAGGSDPRLVLVVVNDYTRPLPSSSVPITAKKRVSKDVLSIM